jgi:ATP-dependent RNA helicase DHX36|tara:strand:- start:8164 stop:8643 length:480 start_codon:yes stop_codon:yes gene_type:complete
MSATVDADLFANYFGQVVPGKIGLLEIPGRTFPVAEYRLEDALEATGYVVDPDGEYALGSEANANSRSVAGNSSRRFNAVSGGATDRNAKTTQALKESLERTSLLDDVSETTRAMYGNSGYSDQTLKCLQVRIARFPNPSAHCFTEADDCLSIHRDIQD